MYDFKMDQILYRVVYIISISNIKTKNNKTSWEIPPSSHNFVGSEIHYDENKLRRNDNVCLNCNSDPFEADN